VVLTDVTVQSGAKPLSTLSTTLTSEVVTDPLNPVPSRERLVARLENSFVDLLKDAVEEDKTVATVMLLAPLVP
jgi:hypothetical protein